MGSARRERQLLLARGLLLSLRAAKFLLERAGRDCLLFRRAREGFKPVQPFFQRQDRLFAQSEAYLEFAISNRGRYLLMWRKNLLDMEHTELVDAAGRAFAILDRTVRGGSGEPFRPDKPELAPSLACWSLVHGLTLLALEGALAPKGVDLTTTVRSILPNVLGHLRI